MDEADPWVGETFADRYEISELIGRGGMAAVYRAKDTLLDRFVAVKIFAPGAAGDDARRRAEVQLLARLNHPNLVTVHDAYLAAEDSAMPSYLVMECVEGSDLRTMLDRGALPGRVTALLAAEIAEALVAVHAIGVVHRDLKPANILLVPTGLPAPEYRAKLTDFGIAHLVGGDRLTTTGVVIGTAAYLSPEQASGLDPGAEADIYALGLVILECLTGTQPFPGTIAEAISARLAHGPEIPRTLPAGWRSLIGQMTQSDPAARPTAVETAVTARQLGPELDDWMPPTTAAAPAASAATDELEPTAAMEQPTQILPVAPPAGGENDVTQVLPVASAGAVAARPTAEMASTAAASTGAAVAPSADDAASGRSARRRRRVLIGAGSALVLIAAIVAAALLLLPQHDSPLQLSPPTSTSTATPKTVTTPAGTAPSPRSSSNSTPAPRSPRPTAPAHSTAPPTSPTRAPTPTPTPPPPSPTPTPTGTTPTGAGPTSPPPEAAG